MIYKNHSPELAVDAAVSILFGAFLIFKLTGDTRSLDIIPTAFLMESMDSLSFIFRVAGRESFEAFG